MPAAVTARRNGASAAGNSEPLATTSCCSTIPTSRGRIQLKSSHAASELNLLVKFDDAIRFTWERLLEKTNGHPALSLIVTPEPLKQLAARLAAWCIVDAADYTVALSFADTRILPPLFKTLTAQQLGQFCGDRKSVV